MKTIPFLLLVFVFGASFAVAADQPASLPAENNSRYIYMPPISSDGLSSGSHAVTICLPAGYGATDRRYPVFYLLDGGESFLSQQNDMRATSAYELAHDQLVHDGLIQPVIFVAVHNSLDAEGRAISRNRSTDYYPARSTNGRTNGEGYYRFLSEKIKPMIDQTYRTLPGPATTGIAGFSAGGAGAFWMTYEHPETFGMALCQSPASLIVGLIDGYKAPIPPVRLWIDAGSRELSNGLWLSSYDAASKLVDLGFVQNDNIAFHTGHNQGHEKFDCNQRLRHAFYFLLRTNTPRLAQVEITETDTLGNGPITLARTGHVVLEPVYENGFRITDVTAKFTLADPSVVTLDDATHELRPQTSGETTIRSTFAGREIVQQIVVPPAPPAQICSAVTRPVVIDGDLSEWAKLPYTVAAPLNNDDARAWSGPADLSYRFACSHDDQFLYVAIETTDDHFNSVPDKDPWLQDGVELRVDARPSTERRLAPENEILVIALSPSAAGENRPPYNAAKLPEGTQVVSKATPTGHITEIAIPFAYLDAKAGQPWRDIRLNLVVNDNDEDYEGVKTDKLWWQPDWRTPGNILGSGTFVR